jgi:outer membrane protein assembly factor BamB
MSMNNALRSLLVGVILLAATSPLQAADWPQFRGPGGQGLSTEDNLPVSWNDTENLLWKTKLPGPGASSPIALGDKLYLTAYSGYGVERGSGDMEDLRLHVLCLRESDGEIVWDREIKPRLPESERVRDHGYAAPTPATDGKHLYVFFGKTGVLKLDLNGELVWQTEVGDGLHGWGCGTSPVLFDNLVIVNASVESGSLVALDQATGNEVWRAGGMRSSWNTPHLVQVNGKTELVVSVKGKILAFDPATGESLWTCEGIQDYVCPSIVSQDGIVYAIGGRSSRAIAVRAGGRGDVTDTHRLWEARAGANVCSPVIHDGHLYWVSDRNSNAYCLRLSDGEVIYQQRFPAQPYASALIGGDNLYIVTRRGGTYVLAAKPEYEQLAHNEFEGDRSTFNASPIIADGKLYIRSDEYLYCVGK